MRGHTARSVALAVAISSAAVAPALLPHEARAADASYGFAVGGLTGDYGLGIAVDPDGNAYTIGDFSGTADLDPGPLTQNVAAQGSSDEFVASYGPTGNVRWAFGLGGTGQDDARDIAVRGAYV